MLFRSIFSLRDPFRIVIDLPREELVLNKEESVTIKLPNECFVKTSVNRKMPSELWCGPVQEISDGVLYMPIGKSAGRQFTSHALLIDRNFADVTPAMMVPEMNGKNGIPFLQGILNFLGFAQDTGDQSEHFSRKRVSTFTKMIDGIAGINGSFFYKGGTPVGALIINGQIISSPLYNRTSLIIYSDGSSAIEALKMEGFFKLGNGQTLSFNGVNQPLKENEIIVYTPDYQRTDNIDSSTNITVIDDKVKEITFGQSQIPKNGYIISAMGTAGNALKEIFSENKTVKWFFMASPPLNKVLHVVAGGPRLIYKGEVYVSSKEERFRNDVAIGKAARTAAGITSDQRLVFVVVDGSEKKEGATLGELANLMKSLGCADAMNLDGGGSSSMVVNGIKVNTGQERAVSNAIIIKKP